MLGTVAAVALVGLDAHPIRLECVTARGLPHTRVVGLPDTAVREARDRVQSAVLRSGFAWPRERVVVSLAPAALPKSGAGFDLPLALAVLGASGQLPLSALERLWACGELGLDGEARPVPGILPVACAARRGGARRLVVPDRAATEAGIVEDLEVVPVADLREAVEVLRGVRATRTVDPPDADAVEEAPNLADVRGQPVARRALEIAAAGGHHLLLVGPPGCGKSMLARRLPGILPPLTLAEALEVAAIHSVAGVRLSDAPLSRRPPFRDPHHSISAAGLIGGGAGVARPGEISIAHRGVLFVDELLEVPRWILDALRQPLEHGAVTVVRARAAVRFPAEVLLVGATNPCPCGHFGDHRRECRCRPDEVKRYRGRLSGPLLDRIDLQVELEPVEPARLLGPAEGESSASVAARVAAARSAAGARWGAETVVRNAPSASLRASCSRTALQTLGRAVDAFGLSARAFDRCLRVARTIADLEGTAVVECRHVDESLAYRLPPARAGVSV
ncbi:MAG: YifB family Mg chelatase-like AAA ATPase [Actinomycetota bacterium]|nr:YifB family Mg chelatase-like AAA ATPase [Actinomycetota bacterium]